MASRIQFRSIDGTPVPNFLLNLPGILGSLSGLWASHQLGSSPAVHLNNWQFVNERQAGDDRSISQGLLRVVHMMQITGRLSP